MNNTAMAVQTPSMTDDPAKENWARYQYGKERGHIEYMEQAEKCEGMYLGGGDQWNETDKAILRQQRRPFYEFNEVMPSINSAVGYQIQNRMDIAYRPRGGQSDLKTATLLSKVAMQVVALQKVHWKETQVFTDGIVEQRGYFELRMNFDHNIKGEIEVATHDPRDVIPDPDAKQYDPDTWADVIITRWLTEAEIGGLYGKKAMEIAKKSNDHGDDFGELDGEDVERPKFGNEIDIGPADAYNEDKGDGIKRYRIIDRQKWVYENTDCLVLPDTGDVLIREHLTVEQAAALVTQGAIPAKRMKKRVRWVVTTYTKTLHDDYSPYEHFSIIPYFAYFRRGKTRGMVDNAIGPQEALNKSVSQYVHIINTTANSGWKVEQGSLVNMDEDELEQRGAETGLTLVYKRGTTSPEKITPNQIPSGVDKLIDRATQALKDVTVPDSMRGLQGNAVSGVAKQADQFASQQQLAVPLDNLNYTRQLLAMRMLKLIQRYYDSPRIFRITETDPRTGKEVEELLEINRWIPELGTYDNDVTKGTYDVTITEQPMQVTFQNSQFEQALAMRKEGVRIPDTYVVRYSNLADKHEMLEEMSQQQQPADPTVEAKAELLRAQAEKTRADTTGKKVETQYSGVQAAQVIATVPQVAPLADALLRSAGYEDMDAAPIVPSPPEGMEPPADPDIPANTNPLTPANPQAPESAAVGVNQGIETPQADGAM